MRLTHQFYKFAGVCAVLTGLTTLAIHLLPNLWAHADTFEEQLGLRFNPIYAGRLWIVIAHCLMVVVSMFALGARRWRESPALVTFGFLAFVVFSVTEILRTSLVIFALNRTWRTRYVLAADESTRELLRASIEGFAGINAALFFVFFVAFLIGLICYGLALRRSGGWERTVGILFLVWAALSVPTLIDTVLNANRFGDYFGWVGYGFQPLARFVTGGWLWRASKFVNG